MLRVDVYEKEVLARCEALKRSGLWLPEPAIRPRAWIGNFEDGDRAIAAQLLERFVFYSQRLTDTLLATSFNSIGDGLQKGPAAPTRQQLLEALPRAVFTPVSGESPNPTDSGYYLCRRLRQVLGVPESQIMKSDEAIRAAATGTPVVFVDDFIGSGDQFITTWQDHRTRASFEAVHHQANFPALYISLVGTMVGIERIGRLAPSVAVCVTHRIDDRGSLWGIKANNASLFDRLDVFLKKYSPRLTPQDAYMQQDDFMVYGYKRRGLFFGFEHSVPDATLPIFWSRGINEWEPLIERT